MKSLTFYSQNLPYYLYSMPHFSMTSFFIILIADILAITAYQVHKNAQLHASVLAIPRSFATQLCTTSPMKLSDTDETWSFVESGRITKKTLTSRLRIRSY